MGGYKRPSHIDPVTWFWRGFEENENGCLEWQRGKYRRGYGVCEKGIGDGSRYSHRVAWVLTHGIIPDGRLVLHHCDNRICGNPAHLYVGTPAENTRDMLTRGRARLGELNPTAKLTEPKVADIRERLSAGETLVSIAQRYEVSPRTIAKIAHGKTWNA